MSNPESALDAGPDRHLSRVFAGGVTVSLVGVVAVGVINYLIRRLLTFVLDKPAYGFFYSAFTLVFICVTLSGTGLGHTVSILVSRHVRRGDHARARAIFGHVLLLRIAVGSVLAVALMLSAPFLIQHYFAYPAGLTAFLLLCFFIPAAAAVGGFQSLLNGLMDFVACNLSDLALYGLVFAGASVGVWRLGIAGVSGAWVLSQLILLPVLAYYVWRHHGMLPLSGVLRGDVAREAWGYSRWTLVTVPGMYLMSSLDTLMLTGLRGVQSVAIYHVAVPVVQIFLVIMVVPSVFIPVASHLWQGGDRALIARICDVVVRAVVLYGWGLILLMVIARRAVIGILFGTGFAGADAPLFVLSIGVPILVLAQFFLNAVAAFGRPAVAAGIAAICTGVNAAMNVALIPPFGVVGAAAATVTAYAVLAALAYRALQHDVGITIVNRANLGASCLGLVCCIVAALVCTQASQLWHLFVVAVTALAVFVLVGRRLLVSLFRDGKALLWLDS